MLGEFLFIFVLIKLVLVFYRRKYMNYCFERAWKGDWFVAFVGMCIGGPYVMGLIEQAPERVASGVLFQTIGLSENREAFFDMFDGWATELRPTRPEVPAEAWDQFKMNMYGSDNVLFNVDEAFLKTVTTPLLVLECNDLYHPSESSLVVNDLAQNTTLIREWMSGAAMESAAEQFAEFLASHSS